MIKSVLVLFALVLGLGANAVPATSHSSSIRDLQAQSCMNIDEVRDLLGLSPSDTVMRCAPEGARCSENSDCCNNHCVGIRCNDNAGN
jgi:hypothetical protein